MERYSEVIGLPVICVDNGKKIGVVNDMIFCPKYKEVKAVILERKGCQIKRKAILMKDIVSMGKDAVIVNDCTCTKSIRSLEKNEELKHKGKVTGLRIYSKSGEDLGIVKDVLFDHKTSVIEGVEVSESLFQDLLQGRNILPLLGKVEFGEENMLVDKEAIEEMINSGGGLKKKLIIE